ncbi:ATP-binding protein [Puniceibacterium sediminis]|uniref:histidine kinase n=1 Tax=Puniceibacterium sediminis TaxID=1608407 RepID=A0A238Z497_9RHOB|nr:ATP-binding protein [Puniceibacterium sediminis]SNR78197.1 PAS domain S-box-containing protein [Puniceibacterium sediminis]
MVRESIYQNTATYSAGMRKTLHRVLDFLAFISMLGVLLSALRLSQVGLVYIVVAALLFGMCVLPSIILRADKHLNLRGFLLIAGYFSAISLGIFNLGLASSGVGALPFILAICAALFSRKTSLLVFALLLAAMTFFAYLFVSGQVSSPDTTLADWNRDPRSWIVAVWAMVVCSLIVTTLIFNLSAYWRETDTESEKKNRQFEAMVEFSPDAIMIFDLETEQIAAANARAEELFGIARDDLENAPKMGARSPERQPSGESSVEVFKRKFAEALAGGHPTFELVVLNAKDEEIHCEISLSRIPPFEQKLVRANMTDISKRLANQKQREDLQAQLAASQRLETIGQFTGGVAHDFNNLLAVILGNLEILQEETDDETRKQLLQPCIDATLRGANLTRSLLSYARQAPLKSEIVDLNKLVGETRKWTGRTLPKNIELKMSLMEGLWNVMADPAATENALLNMILNARDAMPQGGQLTFETANRWIDESCLESNNEDVEHGPYVMVAITDTGTGIADDNLKKIFEPFFTTKPTGEGSGLGLAMVQGFMRQSRGMVQVFSELGVGTTCKLYFPALTDEPEIEVPVRSEKGSRKVSGERILLVEDEEEVLSVLARMLKAAGFAVTCAESGDKAKAIFEADPNFDLLLTDIMMPGQLQGTDLSKKIREIDGTLPVIFMSGYPSEAAGNGNGIPPEDIRLIKPVMRKDLLAAIAQVLETPRTQAGT